MANGENIFAQLEQAAQPEPQVPESGVKKFLKNYLLAFGTGLQAGTPAQQGVGAAIVAPQLQERQNMLLQQEQKQQRFGQLAQLAQLLTQTRGVESLEKQRQAQSEAVQVTIGDRTYTLPKSLAAPLLGKQVTAEASAAKQEDQQKFLMDVEDIRQGRFEASYAQRERFFGQGEAGKNYRSQLMAGALGASSSAAAIWSDAIAGGEATVANIPPALRTGVLAERVSRGQVFVPPKVRDQLAAYKPAQEAMAELSRTMNDYIDSGFDPNKAILLEAQRDGLTRLIGRGMGEVGVFTDQDSENMKSLTSSGFIQAKLFPEAAKTKMRQAQKLIDTVGDAKFGSYMQQRGRTTATQPTTIQGGRASFGGARQVGDVVNTTKGKRRITKINSDGSYEGDPVP